MKKILALILALSMVLSLGVASFADSPIGEINLTLDVPETDEKCDMEVVVSGTDADKIDTDNFGIEWVWADHELEIEDLSDFSYYLDYDYLHGIEETSYTFSPGIHYYVRITVRPKGDSYFTEDTKITVNGEPAIVDVPQTENIACVIKHMGMIEVPVVDEIEIDFKEPVAGEHPVFEYDVVAPSHIYKGNTPAEAGTYQKGYWFEFDGAVPEDFYTDDVKYSDNEIKIDDTFTEGKVHLFWIYDLFSSEPYGFTEDTVVRSTSGKIGRIEELIISTPMALAGEDYELPWGRVNIFFIFDEEEEEEEKEEKGGLEIISRGEPTKGYKEGEAEEYATPLPDTRMSTAPATETEANPNTGLALSIAPLALLAFLFKKRK